MKLPTMYRIVLIVTMILILSSLVGRNGLAQGNSPQGVKNIVLVHGAWADGSCWSKVIAILQAKGFHVVAVQNPLPGLGRQSVVADVWISRCMTHIKRGSGSLQFG